MCMSLKTIALDQCENPVHFALVIDVLGENVFVERIAGRAVDEKKSVFFVGPRPFSEKAPAFFLGVALLGDGFQLAASPKDGPLGRRIESIGVKHRSLIVIAEQCDFALHYQVDAFTRIGPVTDHIAQTVNLVNFLVLDVLEDCFQRLQVAVYIANHGLQMRLSWRSRRGWDGDASSPSALIWQNATGIGI